MKGLTFLGRDPKVPKSDLFKDQKGRLYRKTRGRRDLIFIRQYESPGHAPVAYSTRKRMGDPVRKHVEENDLNVNQVKDLQQAARRCGYENFSDVRMDWELSKILEKAAEKTMHWKITRTTRTEESTIGKFRAYAADGSLILELCTLENPWRSNERMVSCIPAGKYGLEKRTDSGWNAGHKEKFDIGYVVGLTNVPDRTYILFHEGNWAKNTDGCILLGLKQGADYIGSSIDAMKQFYKLTEKYGVPAKIEIEENIDG